MATPAASTTTANAKSHRTDKRKVEGDEAQTRHLPVARTANITFPAATAAAASSSGNWSLPILPPVTTQHAAPYKLPSEAARRQIVAAILLHAWDGHDVKTADLDGFDESQLAVLIAVLLHKKNVFLSGEAGTGKSHVLKILKRLLHPYSTAFTAFTGLAALAVGGTTLSSFAGIGRADNSKEALWRANKDRKKVKENWSRVRAVVVDEVSMASADVLDTVMYFAQQAKQNSRPGGGVQWILSGDFMQLPPVKACKLAYQSACWASLIDVHILLTRIYRQQGDERFGNLLSKLRMGELGIREEALLKKAQYTKLELPEGIRPTTLFPRKQQSADFNARCLAEIESQSEIFHAEDAHTDETQMKALEKDCLAIKRLELKRGAQVMLLKNVDPDHGLCNGSVGIVYDFVTNFQTGVRAPKIQFNNGIKHVVAMESWEIKVNGVVVARRRQFPLVLAWSLTVHKSQGLTLDCVDITAQGMFEVNQLYVAVSRVKTLSGLLLKGFTRDCIRINPDTVAWYHKLEEDTCNTVKQICEDALCSQVS